MSEFIWALLFGMLATSMLLFAGFSLVTIKGSKSSSTRTSQVPVIVPPQEAPAPKELAKPVVVEKKSSSWNFGTILMTILKVVMGFVALVLLLGFVLFAIDWIRGTTLFPWLIETVTESWESGFHSLSEIPMGVVLILALAVALLFILSGRTIAMLIAAGLMIALFVIYAWPAMVEWWNSESIADATVTAPVGEWKCVRVPEHLIINWWGEDPNGDRFKTAYYDPYGEFHRYRGGQPDMRAACFSSNSQEPETVSYELVRK